MFQTVCSVMLLLPVTGDLRVEPAEVTLTGPKATQRLLVLQTQAGEVSGDITKTAKFASSDPKIAAVDAAGQVRAVGDGEATITAIRGDAQAIAKVKVQKTGEPFDWSFANHVVPVL